MRQWNTQQQAQPTRAPDYRIELAGQTLSPELDARLISLSLTDQRGGDADQLDITLSDYDGRLALPPRGAELHLWLGWRDEGLIDRGTYTVDEVTHTGAPDTLTVRARAANMRAGLPGKRDQSWHEITIGDTVDTIASRHDLEPRVADELASVLIEHEDQTDESDMNFLSRLGRRHDAIATVKAGYLLFTPRGEARTAGGTPIPAVTLSRGHGDQHSYQASDRDTFTGVLAYWQDIEGAERQKVVAGTEERPRRLRDHHATQQQAQDAANAEWRRVRRAGAQFSVTLAEGRPDLYPETPIVAKGWKEDIDETPWVVTQVNHSLTESAYTVGVQMEVRQT